VKSALRLLGVTAAMLSIALVPAAGGATTPTPTGTTPTGQTPAPPPPPARAPLAPRMKLELRNVGGMPLFALMGRRIVVRGIVIPYAAGQTVKVSFYREARRVLVKLAGVRQMRNGAGEFRVGFKSSDAGLIQARAVHYATAQQPALSARSPRFRYVWPNLGPGSQGQSVRLLQSELNALHYVVPLDGIFDEGTGRALVAYRKMTSMERVPYAGTGVFDRIAHGGGSFYVRFPQDGRHVEANLTRQVLAEIEAGGHVRSIYIMSSGKPETPTVIGHFQVYEKTPGENAKGMVDSNYFIGGYAIHGYHEVPTYAASHGCLRIPIPDASAVFGWLQIGNSVDVFNESGGGSHRVSGQAGP
jgi:peptidoglycan hydrolase-like protein with peptidoglycan-binding domain